MNFRRALNDDKHGSPTSPGRDLAEKETRWVPSDRSSVCSLHFTENDYKKGTKLRMLLPTAIPTVFPNYPSYMQKPRAPRIRKWPRRKVPDGGSSACAKKSARNGPDQSRHEDVEPDLFGDQKHVAPSGSSDGTWDCSLPADSMFQTSSCTDKMSQTDLDLKRMTEDAKKTTNHLQRKISRLSKSLQTLQSQHDTVRERLQAFESNKKIACFVSVLRAADEGHNTAEFTKNQVSNFASKKPAYTESILRECVLWKACSNKRYEYVRTRGLFKLPCRATLQKYIGHSTGEIGVTSLITERLRAEFQVLQVEQEILCSLIIDEMAIQQKVMYDRQLDTVFGLVDMGPEQQSCATPEVANRLLCFVLRGLSTAYVITVGYFFTRCLRSEQLCSMTMNVMKAVENVGFRVTRIVTDNHQSNVALFKSLSEDGMLAHVVPHPLRQGDPLFLSFDPNHLIKNLRNNLVEREMMDGDNLIQGGLYLKKLLGIQSQLLVKPVRFLTQSHVEPNNLEKMKLSRATQVFSPVVIATLEFLQENPQCHLDATEFQDCLPTITFMKMVSKWYDLHNIGAVKPRGQREEPFYLIDDDRLSWLEVDFITYIEEIQLSGGKTKKKMTKETCEARIMTTRSTVALIQHLLDNK
ncbi:hypothetical protein MRX96_046990 [Rhipicephalus microplus]